MYFYFVLLLNLLNYVHSSSVFTWNKKRQHKRLQKDFFLLLFGGTSCQKWLRWKKLFLNSRLMCEYVKNKAALFALQELSSRNMHNTKGKKSKTRSFENIKINCTVIHYTETLTVAISSWDLMFYTIETNICLQNKQKKKN